MTPVAHSSLGGSSAERWMACPGSIALTEKSRADGSIPPETSSPYAEEGTRAHTLLAQCMETGADAWELPDLADDADMLAHVQSALDAFRALAGGERWIEERVYPLRGREDVFGTVDYAHLSPDGLLSVVDFKYGKGVRVSPRGNAQLRFYALGLLLANPAARRIRTGVHQPRIAGDDIVWGDDMPAEELLEWGERLAAAAAETQQPAAPLSPGEHCRWCPAKAMCPAQSAMLRDAFLSSAPPAELPDHEIGARLAEAKYLRDYITQLEAIVFARLKTGRDIPGWKLVRRKANRAWKEGADKVLVDTVGEQAYSRSLLSPAAAEKLPGCKKLVAEWAYSPDAGLTLAPETDSREAQAGGAAATFADFITPKGATK